MDSISNLASTNKNDILDPLSIIIKLFIYAHKPVGTKISIGYNKLCIQENTYIQGAWRRWNGDTKNDINILLCPILYACVNYLKRPIKDKDKDIDKDETKLFLSVFKVALDGLTNMKQTYAGTPIIYNIEHIVNIINLFINKSKKGKKRQEELEIASAESDSETEEITLYNRTLSDDTATEINTKLNEINSIVNIDTPIYKIKENIYHHLNTSWTPHRKNILFGYIKEITEVHNPNLKLLLINGLVQFMECMDTIVSNVLLNNRM